MTRIFLQLLLFVAASLSFPNDDLSEMKRFPPVEPNMAVSTFDVAEGFSLELVANEPNVSDPVDACFDADGRMFVAEMHGYPFSFEARKQQPEGGGKQNAGIIRLLEDKTGDGRFNTSTVFADELSWPTSVCCANGGVFVIAPPNLVFLKDTDGDNRADEKQIVFSGLSRNNVQSLANNLKYGLDNHIYFAGGRSGNIAHQGKQVLQIWSNDLRFNPKSLDIEPATGGAQFGHSMDDWGNRFVCSNSNHIQHVVWNRHDVDRNPDVAVLKQVRSIAKEGGAAPVFRKSPAEPWRIVRTRRRAADPAYRKRLPSTELVPIGFFTSATGVTICRGSAYSENAFGNVFIGDVGGNLIHRKTLAPSGISYLATRADADREFVTSTDTWFRPVNFVNGPDGCLYVLDMYRETIEHPVSIPDDIKALVDLESGDDRGRIYRLVERSTKRLPKIALSNATNAQLVEQLASNNAWHRETGQRLLVEREGVSAVPQLERLLNGASAVTSIHALWTLAGLNRLTSQHVELALNNPDPRVREHGLRLSDEFTTESTIAHRIVALTKASDPRVQWRAVLAVSDCDADLRIPALTALAGSKVSADLQTAIMIATGDEATGLLHGLIKSGSDQTDTACLSQLARLAAARSDSKTIVNLLQSAFKNRSFSDRLLPALDDGLRSRKSSLRGVIENSDDEVRNSTNSFFARALKTAGNPDTKTDQRTQAIQRLAYAPDSMAKRLSTMLEPTESVAVQQAVIEAIGRRAASNGAKELLSRWSGYSPDVKNRVTGTLLGRTKWSIELLSAIENKDVSVRQIDQDHQQLLLNHPNKSIRTQARALIGQPLARRQAVVDQYQSAVNSPGNAASGAIVFQKNCASCHRAGSVGHQVGPDIQSVKNKTREDLLVSILDPNRDVQPKFHVYNAMTEQGKVVSGIIVNDSAGSITLRGAEAKQQTVSRRNLDSLTSTGISLMTEGLEKKISIKQMTDLLEFIKNESVSQR